MKKSKLKTILILLIIIVLCLSVGVYAGYALSATDVSYTKSDGTTLSVKAALDELRAGLPTKSIGDEVTVGGEKFYVLGWDNNRDTVDLIAKYNLNSSGTAQSSSSVTVVFSSTNYWSSSFTSSPFNLNDVIGFTSTDALGKSKSYGRSKGAVASRLLSFEEAKALQTKERSNTKIATMLWGKENTNGYLYYWLGSAYSTSGVWGVYGRYGTLDYGTYSISGGDGVRPVITVLKSSIS
ncbi:MAG: hypothetical protein PUB03_04670 [bacterium]|nr:hypothetical protein [bacterium]